MHPFQCLKIMCMVAAKALDKQGNMPLIKISFISLLIKRLILVIECLWPSPLGFSLLSFACYLFGIKGMGIFLQVFQVNGLTRTTSMGKQ